MKKLKLKNLSFSIIIVLLLLLNKSIIKADTVSNATSNVTSNVTSNEISDAIYEAISNVKSDTASDALSNITSESIYKAMSDARAIIGSDDRKVAANPDPRIMYILTAFPNGEITIGTGFLISNRYLLTAAHVMYDSYRGGRYSVLTAIPAGRDYSGTYGVYVATDESVCHEDWRDGVYDKDYGVVVLDRNVPYTFGKFALEIRSDFTLMTADPHDGWKKPQFTIQGFGGSDTAVQWYSKGPLKNVSHTKLIYDLDTEGGTSCSPIISSSGNVVGIHNLGFFDNQQLNAGIRITVDVLEQLDKWNVPYEIANLSWK